MLEQTQYVIYFADQTQRRYQDIESLVENHVGDDDALNVVTFFDMFSDAQFNQFHALDRWNEPCLIENIASSIAGS